MPRERRRTTSAPLIPSTSLVASAVRYPGRAPRIFRPQQTWQANAYRHYGICGEARFAAKFFAHAVSRAVLSVAEQEGGLLTEQQSGAAVDIFAALFNGRDGQVQMLDAIGTHLTIAGECYLVGRTPTMPDGSEGDEVWEIVSCIEMKVTGSTWQITYGDGLPPLDLTDDDVVIRIWLPHPMRRIEADSPFRSLLPILDEIELLTLDVFGQVRSRLKSAGILFLPQGMTFPPPPEVNGQTAETANEADSFMQVLADGMMTAIAQPGSPEGEIPIVVIAPDEAIDKVKLLDFWNALDEHSMSLRNEAIRRFALGMDLPPEQVLGIGSNSGSGGGRSNGVSHWGAWQIEEATIKLHIEPMLDVIVNALTIGYLRPLLTAGDTSRVIYNTAHLRLRPDRSKEASELYDRGLVSAECVVRENGLQLTDMPNPEEFQRWLLIKIASGSATPAQVEAAMLALGVDLGVDAAGLGETPGTELPQAPSTADHPTRDLPDDLAASLLLAASEGLVFRALERSGNRMRQQGQRPPGVPAYETHVHVRANGSTTRLLEDAWSCAPQILAGIADPDSVVPVLNSYVTTLLAEQAPHTRERLSDWLSLAKVS